VNWRIWTQWPLVAKSLIGLPPASSPVEATAAEQKNNDYDDKKRGHVHGFYVLGQSVHSVPDTTHAFLIHALFVGCCNIALSKISLQ